MKSVAIATLASVLALTVGSPSAQQQSKAEPTAQQVGDALKKADRNGDGVLDMKEAGRLGISRKVFETANPDKDGTLDAKELLAAVTARFTAANPDNDGTLDWAEAKKAGIKSKKTFEAANPDKDGTLDVAEYLTALTMQMR